MGNVFLKFGVCLCLKVSKIQRRCVWLSQSMVAGLCGCQKEVMVAGGNYGHCF